ncbi:adapter-related protein complex 1 beta 1 subunit [Naegleria gruberi]|uniref:Adapter-related protein complex 1 beta 1 subunit n=1 Tax=Naegleria gruberi TaxID=5762 RepID=D2VMT9_NAEGR|nr:adapter-related protein complex 1 beta 1 subunit [Naegleria gruberi]EFC41797.1 adapter-related protein complex 1 beta 1 subunit [Naegleria gruberi]|eukprot:XP_002674541.1 adapter-related protein complex 1 beta 1 subunit [Naegleria gruberi strain NEG-M]
MQNEGKEQQKAGGFFSSQNKRSEINEWRLGLGNEKESVRKDTVKKVIAAMTVGKDVSMLFTDVIKCVATNNIELKKLVYLYIMNYAKTQPDLAIMAVNQFERDSNHPNPLIRGLAVRTMGCIRVNKIVEYLAEPIRKTIKDKDPYVRKTAAVAIAKLFDINAEMAIEQGFVEALEELLTDDNPMVVANAVKALDEISSTSSEVILDFTEKTVKTLLAALNQCTEWGQVFILDALSNYQPKSDKETTEIAERVAPRLQHANSAVVLSAVRVINKMIDLISNENEKNELIQKISAPLVTLLSGNPEIQYVALRNIDLIVQSRPGILANNIKMFFCKYNDPIYVKLEKLDIMVKLASERNVDTVLMEFKEYATEVDVEFVRRSVRAIGRCAIKLERAAQRCVDVLLDLIQTKVNYVVQEAIIVIKDIFRRYPNKYEGIIGKLCENLDTLDEPEAKASMIWIIGEYSNKIENADELLQIFIDTFHDETSLVQLQALTAVMKLFLRRPNDTRDLIKKVLHLSTEESDNPDLRDRGYIYWRLLNEDPEAAKAVVLSEKPVIRDDSTNIPKTLLNELVKHIGTLSSVYHKPPELFVAGYKKKKSESGEDKEVEDYLREQQHQDAADRTTTQDILGLDDVLGMGTGAPAQDSGDLDLDDVLGVGSSQPQLQFSASTSANANVTSLVRPAPQKKLLLTADKSKGLQIYGAINRNARGGLEFLVTFENLSQQPITGYACKFNTNTFGFVPGQVQANGIMPGQKTDGIVPILPGNNESDKVSPLIQVAIKTDLGVAYFADSIPFSALFIENGSCDRDTYLTLFQSIPDETESTTDAPNASAGNASALISRLQAHNIFFVADHQDAGLTNYYFSAKFNYGTEEVIALLEIVVSANSPQCKINTRCAETQFIPFIEQDVARIVSLTF